MRNAFRLHAALLVCMLLVAQVALANDPQKVSGEQSFRGCLTGTDDNYQLRAEDGTLYRLHSDKDIDEHVGNTVEVKGSIENEEREQQAQVQAGVAAEAGAKIPTKGINVNDLKTVSAGCAEAKDSESASAGVAGQSSASASGSDDAARTESADASGAAQVGTTGAAGTAQAGTTDASGAAQAGVGDDPQRLSGEQSFRGCLTGTDDNYQLRAEDGTLYRLHSDKDIDEHVGNTVEVRGSIENEEREQQAQQQAGIAAEAGAQVPTRGINVEDLKTVSMGCADVQNENPNRDQQKQENPNQ